MDLLLTDTEIRVLGCLMEKEMATPEYYPLSLNSLTNACNQKSNREPVVSFSEEVAATAISALKEKQLVWQTSAGRVAKFAENFVKLHNLVNREAALLCVLMLRGPQTVGELRGRSERLHGFGDLGEVEAALEGLAEMGWVTRLPRQPGRKESRYMHLLAGPVDADAASCEADHPPAGTREPSPTRLQSLEEEVASLRLELDQLRDEFQRFKEQF
ncbi:MAG: YceH family protein [Desulfobulbaceae bacterium]|nr:YceH family protein [Desulfobulbaceae bacterium]